MPKPHVIRMHQELEELSERMTKLAQFIVLAPVKEKLNDIDQRLLRTQLSAMQAYQEILEIRIALENEGMEHTQ